MYLSALNIDIKNSKNIRNWVVTLDYQLSKKLLKVYGVYYGIERVSL